MSDLLALGASGVRAYQGALGTVSENIANSGVAGYSRRTTKLSELATAETSLTVRRSEGYGVRIDGVARQADAFRATAVRTASADLSRSEAGAAWLDRIENALTGNQAGARVTSFFTAARTLAADPTSSAARAAMLEAGTGVANAFTATASALDAVRDQVDASGDDAAERMTSLAQSLARTNDRIARAPVNSSGAASLADERDRLLDQMSELSDVDVTLDTAGRASVRLGGAAGPTLVAGGEAGTVTYARSVQGVATFAVHRTGETAFAAPAGGAMAGVIEGAGRVADARATLDGVAADFADAINTAQAAGDDLNGQPGAAMFKAGATASDLRLVLTDPRGIAAATRGGGVRDAGNLDEIEAARTSAGTETRLAGVTATNAAALQQRRTVAEAQGAIRDAAVSARDAVSGVDLDAEAVDLIRFQQAYQASSRVIQVARETFQTILDSGR